MTYTETIESLRCCSGFGTCSECKAKSMMEEDPLPCKLSCKERLGLYAADLIERLSAENAELRKEIEWKDMVIALAQRKQAEAEVERDAAIVDLRIFAGCAACKHCCNHRRYHQESLLLTCCDCAKKQNCKCGSCSLGRSNWEWRGLSGAPEEGE